MTILRFSITLDIEQLMTLEKALLHYQAACEREIANGVHSPFERDNETVQHLLSKGWDKIHTAAGTFSKSQLDEMIRTRQFPDEFYDV
jgi:hypothetical protein